MGPPSHGETLYFPPKTALFSFPLVRFSFYLPLSTKFPQEHNMYYTPCASFPVSTSSEILNTNKTDFCAGLYQPNKGYHSRPQYFRCHTKTTFVQIFFSFFFFKRDGEKKVLWLHEMIFQLQGVYGRLNHDHVVLALNHSFPYIQKKYCRSNVMSVSRRWEITML